MLEKFFFDWSAILAFTRGEVHGPAVIELIDRIKRAQRITSVLVACECYRGIPLSSAKRKSQMRVLNALLEFFALNPVYEAQAMAGARLFRYSAGAIAPILAAQCIDGNYTMVTIDTRHFINVPAIKIATQQAAPGCDQRVMGLRDFCVTLRGAYRHRGTI